jgi:uncharacterized protein
MRTAALALALLLATGCRQEKPLPPRPQAGTPLQGKPALWKLWDEDTVIWLFGTIHVLPNGYRWQNGRVPLTVTTSDRLVLETIVPKEANAAAGLIFGLGQSPGLPPLAARVPPDKRPLLREMVAKSGLPADVLDRMESWAAGFLLTATTLNNLGLDAGNGVEEQLSARFEAAGKPVTGLETVREQLGFFDDLPEADQRAFLVGVLDDPASARRQFDAMLGAWARGDEDAIARSFDEELEATPHLRDVLIARRNAAWTGALQKMLADQPGTILVAVGAGHLAGKGSVVDLLKAHRLHVERVQ